MLSYLICWSADCLSRRSFGALRLLLEFPRFHVRLNFLRKEDLDEGVVASSLG